MNNQFKKIYLKKDWWKSTTVYQIYPMSFKDSNNDGYGDIKGIIEKISYLKELGVETLWLSPIFASQMVDNGYDVDDYLKINSLFGTMKDVEELITKCNNNKIKIIFDIVLNHCSTNHEWFIKAKNNLEYSKYFYITKKPIWIKKSVFGGESWSLFDDSKYFLHSFANNQADLNWNNKNVRDEFCRILNFWINKGISGFRFDVIDDIGKSLNENKILNNQGIDYKKLHKFVKYLKSNSLWNKRNLLTVGESWSSSTKNASLYTNPKRKEISMIFGFEHVTTTWKENKWNTEEFSLVKFKNIINKWQCGLYKKGWNSLFLNNHDLPRLFNVFGDINNWDKSIKCISLSYYFLQGTVFLYQGEEIGMTNSFFKNINEHKDIEVFQTYKEFQKNFPEKNENDFLKKISLYNRDNARTPMQWSNNSYAGFTNKNTKPWLSLNKNYSEINVYNQMTDNDSILNWYKKWIKIRKNKTIKDIMINGKFNMLMLDDISFFCYEIKFNKKSYLVLSNWSNEIKKISLNLLNQKKKKIILNNYQNFDYQYLQPWQSLILI